MANHFFIIKSYLNKFKTKLIMTALQHSLKQQALRLAGMKKFLQSQENTERQGEISNRIAIVEIQQEELQKFLDI